MQNTLSLLAIAGPAALLLAFCVSRADQGLRPSGAKLAATLASLTALFAGTAACAGLAVHGARSWSAGEGLLQVLSVRLDAVSGIMLLLVSFIGAVVIRYSATYLDGEARQGKFTGWLCLTLAAVMVLVVAGNLLLLTAAWIAMSLCLHKLLLFYPDRVQAVRAARKKFIIARAGDAALAGAAAVLFAGYGTGDISAILEAARS
ncbi:MAG: proton-conducting transporter membrane subunit, partial [Anderseniella sp.]|nr:proton-conducting transporter membrane subunit [Anderseniella sp.]